MGLGIPAVYKQPVPLLDPNIYHKHSSTLHPGTPLLVLHNHFSLLLAEHLLHNALVNQIPHYPPPGQMRGFDKGIDKRHFPQGRAFDITP